MPLLTTILRVMRLTAVILLAFSLHVSAKLQSQVTLSANNAPLEKVFESIKKQSGFHFLFDVNNLKDAGTVTVHVKNVSLEEAIKACLKNKNLTYEIQDKVVIIKKKLIINPPAEKADAVIDITGKVQLDNGEAVVGATVLVKGTDRITTTNASGDFELKQVFDNAILIISGVSIETVEIPVNGRTSVSINVKAKFNELDATVVKGYYNTTKRLNTGNVSTVKGEDIQKQPVSDPILALEGRSPGLFIQQASGIPGAYPLIRLRGQNSIANGNNPLFIVDGIPFNSNTLTNISSLPAGAAASPFNYLNPLDIVRIDILKDADATAIYGSRGANGVIIITTKKGYRSNAFFDLNINSGIGMVGNKMDLLNTKQYLEMRHEAFNNDGVDPTNANARDLLIWDTTRYTDWQKELIGRTAHLYNAQASLSGGNENLNYLISGTYNKQTTVFPGSFSDTKGSLHMSISHISKNKKLNITISGLYLNDNSKMPQRDFTDLITLAPNAPKLYDSIGNLNWENLTFTNPLANTRKKHNSITKNIIGNALINYEIIRGLSFKGTVGYNNIQIKELIITPLNSFTPRVADRSDLRETSLGTNEIDAWNIEPMINYQKSIDRGKLEAQIGLTYTQSIRNAQLLTASDFPSDELLENLSAAASLKIYNVAYSKYRYNAGFARVGYNYNNKYLINFTGRRDGSSRFGSGNQFGNFGAVGIGWVFSNENFIQKHVPWLSYGKIRSSYGTTGNDQLGDYEFMRTYSPDGNSYLGSAALAPARLPNAYYSWETVRKMELGVEMAFMQNRIQFEVSYYRNRSGNQLVGYSVPSITGAGSVTANLPAVVQNTGLEIELNSINVHRQHFHWETNFNITIPSNKLIAYPNLAGSNYANTYVIGQPLYIRKSYKYAGVNPETGIIEFAGKSGTTVSPSYPDDLLSLQQVYQQSFFGGIDNRFVFNNWELDFFVQFVKQDAYLYNSVFFVMPGAFNPVNSNQPTLVLDRWRKPGDVTDIPKFSQDYGSEGGNTYSIASNLSDYSIGDASFIKLKNASVSYSLKPEWLRKISFEKLKLYALAQNVFTITKYKGLDPETHNSSLPPLRIITFGLQLSF